MVIADPAKGANSFKDESDFHKVAQGKCVDMLVAHTPRASWQDKAFKGSLKIASIRDPVLRAISAYEHSIKCGQHCSMCWKLINDKVRWARQCHDVADAQYNLMRGVYEDVEDIIDDYDFVLVTERYLESLIVLRHVLGISLVEMLYIDIDDEGDTEGSDSHVVSLTGQPQRFLDVVVSRNQNDRKLYDTANVYTHTYTHYHTYTHTYTHNQSSVSFVNVMIPCVCVCYTFLPFTLLSASVFIFCLLVSIFVAHSQVSQVPLF